MTERGEGRGCGRTILSNVVLIGLSGLIRGSSGNELMGELSLVGGVGSLDTVWMSIKSRCGPV